MLWEEFLNIESSQKMIAPSILNADNLSLKEQILEVKLAGIKRLHIDIMDGHFVPNLSYGPELIKCITRDFPDMEIEIHLMSNNLPVMLPLFANLSCAVLEFHLEATAQIDKWIEYVRNKGIKVALAINPDTPVEKLVPFLDKIDQVLLMSVQPGFGGQKFRNEVIDKIVFLKKMMANHGYVIPLEIDGGINDVTANKVKAVGADIVVAGSYIFKHGMIKEQIDKLKCVMK